MTVIKRDGTEAPFDMGKIRKAIDNASRSVPSSDGVSLYDYGIIIGYINEKVDAFNRAISVEEIQDIVETALMKSGCYEVAKAYIRYRYDHQLARTKNTTDETIMSLVNYENESVKQENSNKNPEIIPTQRDYIAGEVSKDLSDRYLLPHDVIEADKLGLIHFHDKDYFIQRSHNCDLVNLEDMLQNGTVISGVLIEKPKSFSTACNIATQVVAQVASCQYGGQSISLSHLAPFVQVSRDKIKSEVTHEFNMANVDLDADTFNDIVERRVREEIKKGVQTIQYQVVTLMTTNG